MSTVSHAAVPSPASAQQAGVSDLPAPGFVEPESLAELLKSDARDSVLVLDVRGEDFAGGNIKGAVNVESGRFEEPESVEKIVQEYLDNEQVGTVVVHCAKSQKRGPRAAAKLLEVLLAKGITSPGVLVLRGGYSEFEAKYKSDDALVENVSS